MDELFMDVKSDDNTWTSRSTCKESNKLATSLSKAPSILGRVRLLPEKSASGQKTCSLMGNLMAKPLRPVLTSSSQDAVTNGSECIVVSDSQSSSMTSSQHSASGREIATVRPIRRSRAEVTLDKYRSYMGLDKLKPVPTSRPAENQLSFMEEWSVCSHCRYAQNQQYTRCRRCGRKIDTVKSEDGSSERPSPPENQPSSPGISGHSFYRQGSNDSVRPVVVPVRSVRVKKTEPQCVTLSSDEDDDEPEIKRPREGFPENVNGTDAKLLSQTPSVEELSQSEEVVSENLQVDCWKEAAFEGSFVALYCHCIRIGSYQTAPKDRVLLCKKGIKLQLPVYNDNKTDLVEETASLFITVSDILHMKIYLGNDLPSFFILVSPKCAGLLRNAVNLKDAAGPYLSPQSSEDCQRYITILPNSINEEGKCLIRNLFPTLVEEVTLQSTIEMLVRMSPPWVHEIPRPPGSEVLEGPREDSGLTAEEGKTERTNRERRREVRRRLPEVCELFRWLDEFVVTTEDYLCLNKEEYLNDNIIEFYIRYLCRTLLTEEEQQKYHVFSSFFYNKLNTKPKNEATGSQTSAAERRHQQVKSWTKKVNLFEKDFIIVPINQNFHWFLAIVCFPGLDGPRRMRDDRPVAPRKDSQTSTRRAAASKIDSSTLQMLKMDWSFDDFDLPSDGVDQADDATASEGLELEGEVVTLDDDEPIKQPCILVMDSLAGDSHTRVIHTLREYLMIEYREKYGDAAAAQRLFNKTALPGTCLQVAQQPNFSDCGVYVLQYVESFLTDPIRDYRLPLRDYRHWFPESQVRGKRAHIQQLLLNLMEETSPGQESLRSTLLQVTLQEPPPPVDRSTGPEIMEDGDRDEGDGGGRLSPVLVGNRRPKPITINRSQTMNQNW